MPSHAGTIGRADRIQRLAFGLCLTALTLAGLVEGIDWKKVVALSLQIEMLATGLVGWCPIYWVCRRSADSD